MKKDVQKALEKAKQLEKKEPASREEIVKIYKEGLEEAEKLRKLLKPQWFISDTHKKKKSTKKTRSPTRKKKSL